jgi:hypothetical protein
MPYQLLHNDETSWHFFWTAPAAGTGPLTLYAAAVDGNGGTGSADDDQDPLGDDTVNAVVSITERGAPGAVNAISGCAIAARGSSGAAWVVMLLFLLHRLSKRRGRTCVDGKAS